MNKVIHESLSADIGNYTYNQVYCGGATAVSVTINGTVVNMAPSTTLDIMVKSITGATNVYLIGIKAIAVPPTQING